MVTTLNQLQSKCSFRAQTTPGGFSFVGYIEARLVFTLYLFFSTSNSTTLQTFSDGRLFNFIHPFRECNVRTTIHHMQSVNCWWETHFEDANSGMATLFTTVEQKNKMKSVLTSYLISAAKHFVVKWKQKRFYSVNTSWTELQATERRNKCMFAGLWFQAINKAIPCTVTANTPCCADVWQVSH